jgi:hypothetical protein
MTSENLLAFWQSVQNQVLFLLALVVLDVLFGIYVAFRQKRFELEKLAGYIDSDLIPILVWLAVSFITSFFGQVIPEAFELVAPNAVYVTVVLKIGGSLLGHWSALGVLPKTLNKVGVKPSTGEG